MILIAGGETDPNIGSILGRARERGDEVFPLLVGPNENPALFWDVEADRLEVNGREIRPESGFLRYDVFHNMADPRPATSFRAQAWYTTLQGWALAHEGVRILNRGYAGQTNKPFMLSLARQAGLQIPLTWITNELGRLEETAGERDMIAKPVPGGGYTQHLRDLLSTTERREGKAAAPAFVQGRLVNPEVRIYGIGGRFLPFHVKSEALDYRDSKDTSVHALPLDSIDAEVIEGLGRLMERLRMDYGAADFKTDPETGKLVFLEINSGPMFVAFDAASGHAVSDALLDTLAGAAVAHG